MKKLFFTAIVLLLSVNSFSVQAQNCDAAAAPFVNWSGCDKSNADLLDANLLLANLGGANLNGANLSSAELSGANLSGANLTNADLTTAYLTNADLTGANLTGANLTYADLTGANLSNVNLTGANLTGAILSGATLTGVVSGGITGTPSALPAGWALVNGYGYLVGPGANLTGADLSGANLTNANLKRAALDGANLTGATLTGVVSGGITGTPSALPVGWMLFYGNLLGPGANLSGLNLSGLIVNNPNLSGANLTNAILVGTELYGGNLSGADLSGANLSLSNFFGVNLTGANLSSANLSAFLAVGITGTPPPALPAGWALVMGYLIGPGANTYFANLSGADLTNFNLSGAIFWNANLTGTNLSGANLANAFLGGADLTGATLTGVVSGGITGNPSALPDGWQLINGYLVGPATCGDGRYAEQVVSFNQKKAINETAVVSGRSDNTKALCAPQNNDTENFVSLGFGGDITLKFGKAIRNGEGNDIRVYESTFGNLSCTAYPEKARVFASQDGCRFVYLGEICQDGTVDLGALNWAQYVRIVDVSSKTAVYQSSGTPDGYDVDAVEALNGFETNPVLDPIAGGASEVVLMSYLPGKCRGGANISADRTDKNKALGVPQGSNEVNFVSLGFGGKITLRFKYAVENNATGFDLQVVETSYGNPSCNSYPEKARFEGSIDGTTWTDLGELCLDGKLELGTLPYLHLLRITDVSDKTKFGSSADGFDVDGVVAINQCAASNARMSVEITDDINTADEVELAEILELYPNPASSSATFSFSSQTESSYEVNIVNALGQVVYRSEGKSTQGGNTLDLNLETLKPGLHIVQLVQDGSRQQVNLMKR